MNKFFVYLIVGVLILSMAAAKSANEKPEVFQGPDGEMGQGADGDKGNMPEDTGNNENNINNENLVTTQNKGEESQLKIQEKEQLQTQKMEVVKQKIEAKKKELSGNGEQVKTKDSEMVKSQNQVRVAVHAMLEMKDVLGGIGPQVSEIAKEFDNSVQATVQAEEKISKKSGLARFFSGGDEKAAEEIEGEVVKNQNKLQELKQLMKDCEDCYDEAKAMLQEQVQSMEQEQLRLKEKAEKEKKSKGLFGWMWK
ncbi:MAG: hypothetical protein KKF44_07280 [Nanoarchaeota archaeon]|nr:hypothetical protein [Nanoarchaeota archaeon]